MGEKRTHVLLVEDEQELAQVTAERLEDHGYKVTQVTSGAEARPLLVDFAFDVIITDLRLPGIDGTKLLEEAKTRYQKPQTKNHNTTAKNQKPNTRSQKQEKHAGTRNPNKHKIVPSKPLSL